MAAMTDEAIRHQAQGSFLRCTAGEVVATAVGDDPEIWSVRLLKWAGDRYEPTDEVIEAHSRFRWARAPRQSGPRVEPPRPPYVKQVTAGPGERVLLFGPHPTDSDILREDCRGRRYSVVAVCDDDPLKNY